MPAVFWNLSNHASNRSWSEAQVAAARVWGGSPRLIRDVPFPLVDPESSREEVLRLAEVVRRSLLEAGALPGDPALVMGEFSLVHALVSLLQAEGLVPLTATTRRDATEELRPDGSVVMTHSFCFVRFRPY